MDGVFWKQQKSNQGKAQQMKPGGGKAKGAGFERLFCKMLSEWWGEEDAFWRSPGSGAMATVSKRNAFYGDISSPSSSGEKLLQKVVIELKKGYGSNWSPFDLIEGGPKTFTNFLEQVSRDKEASGRKHIWLVFQKPRKKIVFCANVDFFIEYYPKEIRKFNYMKIKTKEYSLMLMLLEDFLKHCPAEKLMFE